MSISDFCCGEMATYWKVNVAPWTEDYAHYFRNKMLPFHASTGIKFCPWCGVEIQFEFKEAKRNEDSI